MNLLNWAIAVSAFALTYSAYAQTGLSDVTTHQYGSALQRNLNTAIAPSPAPAPANSVDAARRCGELAKTYADSYNPQSPNYAGVGAPNYGRDGRNYEMGNDLSVRARRDDAEKAYRDSGCG